MVPYTHPCLPHTTLHAMYMLPSIPSLTTIQSHFHVKHLMLSCIIVKRNRSVSWSVHVVVIYLADQYICISHTSFVFSLPCTTSNCWLTTLIFFVPRQNLPIRWSYNVNHDTQASNKSKSLRLRIQSLWISRTSYFWVSRQNNSTYPSPTSTFLRFLRFQCSTLWRANDYGYSNHTLPFPNKLLQSPSFWLEPWMRPPQGWTLCFHLYTLPFVFNTIRREGRNGGRGEQIKEKNKRRKMHYIIEVNLNRIRKQAGSNTANQWTPLSPTWAKSCVFNSHKSCTNQKQAKAVLKIVHIKIPS